MNTDSITSGAESLIFGWAKIGLGVGQRPDRLRQLHADGRLPVAPLKFGHSVAYTGGMLATLRDALAARATSRTRD